MQRALRRRVACALALTVVALGAGVAPAAAADPATNDAFANATVIAPGGVPYTDEVDATGATTEAEAASGCGSGDNLSIWYRITPATPGYLHADTFGSGNGDLTIYKGTTLASLVEVACNDVATDGGQDARVAFKVAAGTRYYIRITNSTGTTVLHVRTASRPSNDDFANATNVTSLPFTSLTDNIDATLQSTEPDPAVAFVDCARSGATIWYRITTASTMVIRADTFRSGIDTWIAAYRGTAIGSLTPVVCNDDTSAEGTGYQSNVAFKATAGQTYYLQVGGFAGENSDIGVHIAKVTPPANNAFASPTPILADGVLHRVGATRGATWQGTEPTPDADGCVDAVTSSSVWYTFTPTANLFYIVDTFGSNYRTVVAVYTGSSLGSLTLAGCTEGEGASVDFNASSGTTYRIQVSGSYGDSGSLHVHMTID